MNSSEFQALCLSLPGAIEDLKWENDLCFCVAGKMFAVLGIANDPISLSFKTTPELFDVLICRVGALDAANMNRTEYINFFISLSR